MEERQERQERENTRREEGEHSDRKGGPRGPRFKKKTCRFCENKDLTMEYERVDILVKLVSNKGKILPRRLTGSCAKHQRDVAKAIKKARNAGFMPFSV